MSQENNFVPEQGTYKPLTPFHLFVKSNFPFIEATYEALDNYGLYCKVVEYLNNVIENENTVENNVTALYNAFVSLNNYVSNYFDNLDVQEEINNKLDDMASSGELQQILQRQYQDILNQMNENYHTLDNKIDSVASGSPAGVYSTVSALTTANPDHTKIYIVTADGYWYYWNDSSEQWSAGGVYQASVDNETVEHLEEVTEALYLDNYYSFNPIIREGKQLAQNGTFTTLARACYLDFVYCKKGTTIYLPSTIRAQIIKFSTAVYSSLIEVVCFNTLGCNYTLDEDCFIRMAWYYANGDDLDNNLKNALQCKLISTSIREKIDQSYNEVLYTAPPTILTGKYVTSEGELANLSRGCYLDFTYCKKGTSISIPATCRISLAKFSSPDMEDFEEMIVDGIVGFNIVLDEDCHIRLSWNYADGAGLDDDLKNSLTMIRYNLSIKEKIENDLQNNLTGKSIINMGDSIAHGAGNDGVGYSHLIATENAMTLYDYSKNGAFMSGTGGSLMTIESQIDSAISNVPEGTTIDFIMFEGGTNDIGSSVPVGELLEGYDTTNANTSTYIGAMERAIDRLRTQWSTANIIFIMVHKMTSRNYEKQLQYHNAQKQVCDKWCIPYVDIFDKGQITSYIPALATTCFPADVSTPTGYDRTHPNGLGYKQFYVPMIKAKMIEYLRTIS